MNFKNLISPVTIISAIIVFAIIVGAAVGIGSYNSIASAKNGVDKAWSDVETTYQRRADLIPNLVSVAEQASIREQEILDEVIEARAKAVNTSSSDPSAVAQNEGELTNALNKLMVVSEAYPELQSNENWISLQSQIEGTENRINVARRDYNEVAQSYNNKIVTFPSSMFASTFGFEKAEYFKSDEGSEKAPDITFDNNTTTQEG